MVEIRRREMKVTKVLDICGGHQLDLPYPSKCCNKHGHNYHINVTVQGVLNEHGMVCDFKLISNVVKKLDHIWLNDIIPGAATAENISFWIVANVNHQLHFDDSGMGNKEARVVRVTVGETDGNVAIWEE